MPLVVHPRNYAAWIDPSTENPADSLVPFDDGRREAYPGSTLVNDSQNDSPSFSSDRRTENHQNDPIRSFFHRL